jgi:hypothetical protein
LREGGVLSPSNGEPSKKDLLRVERPDRTAEFRWIAEHRQEYAGQWVALHGDRLLSHSTDAREIFAKAYGHDITLQALGFQFDLTAYFTEMFAFGRNVLGRFGWMQQEKLGLVDYEGKLYVGRYDADGVS